MAITLTGGVTLSGGLTTKPVVPSTGQVVFAGGTMPNSAAYVTGYQWSSETGFGTKFTDPGIATQLGSGEVHGVSISPNGASIAITGGTASPYVVAYGWSSSGFGTKYSNPSVTPAACGYSTCRFSPNSDVIFLGGSPLQAYQWSSSTGFGTKYSNPSSISIGQKGIAVSPDGSVVAAGGSANIAAYSWNYTTGFGSKYSDPPSITTGGTGAGSITFNTTGDVIMMGQSNYPYVNGYRWSNSTGFGTRYSDPPAAGFTRYLNGQNVAFSPDGKYVAIGFGITVSGSPNTNWPFYVYNWDVSTGFGSVVTAPTAIAGSTLPAGEYGCTAVMFTKTGDALIVGNQSGYVFAWRWSSSGFGTQFTSPSPAYVSHAIYDASIYST